jgi:hypothetical protein
MEACTPDTVPTCEDLAERELAGAQATLAALCEGTGIAQILNLLIAPPWASNPDDNAKALVRFLTTQPLCRPTNQAGKECVQLEGGECCGTEIRETGCYDPDACDSKVYGYDLLAIIRSAIRADSMVVLPVRNLSLIEAGESLVWDPTALPENPQCDPCTGLGYGAFVPAHLYEGV